MTINPHVRPVLLRHRSLMRGVFDAATGPASYVVTESSSNEPIWPYNSPVISPESPADLPQLVDDCSPTEHAKRVGIAQSHGHEYNEEFGVQSILSSLTPHEYKFLADPNMPLRHYRAEKGNLQEAIRKIKSTLKWREEFCVDDIKRCFDSDYIKSVSPEKQKQLHHMAEVIARENETGKIYCRGYDRQGRAILYLTPGKENSNNEIDNMRHLVYHLERAIACTRRKSGRQKVCIVIGYEGFKLANAPPMSTTKHTLTILQHHYPERMFRAYICDPPFVFRTFWGIIRHVIDQCTLDKIAFCSGAEGQRLLERDFDVEQTERQAGGTRELRRFSSREFLYNTPFVYGFDDVDL
ncbi:hypothetical protein ACHAWO_006499 [Cyclotella atomus]|uniref:CRAL-TRIO domain-containing protein n=1 Tax=Cyclotella atomus TaxID=382360 RepID=A0ABD3Q262_9STRA